MGFYGQYQWESPRGHQASHRWRAAGHRQTQRVLTNVIRSACRRFPELQMVSVEVAAVDPVHARDAAYEDVGEWPTRGVS